VDHAQGGFLVPALATHLAPARRSDCRGKAHALSVPYFFGGQIPPNVYSPFLRYNGAVSLKLYLISCDLLEAGDYTSLKARLRTFEARQVLANQWALHSTHSAAQLKEILRQFLHEKDRIVVTEVGAERASRRALCNLAEL
jgi:hypothetical protein